MSELVSVTLRRDLGPRHLVYLPSCATSRALHVYHIMRFALTPHQSLSLTLTRVTCMRNSDVHFINILS